MKKTTIAFIAAIATSGLILMRCSGDPATTDQPVTVINPVDLPTNIVPGFNFPEDSNLIYSWMQDTVFNDAAIYAHAWGVWAGLTANSGEVYQGDTLLVFETWMGITEIQNVIKDPNMKATSEYGNAHPKKGRTLLATPNQLHHAAGTIDSAFSKNGNNFFVSVAYSPAAAGFAISNSIMRQDVVDQSYTANGVGYIKPFPSSAVTLKPTYFAAKPEGNLIRIPVWPGMPEPVGAFDHSIWDCYVYADTSNSQVAGKPLTPVYHNADPSAADIAAATCNLDDFIHYYIDSTMAANLDTTQAGQGAALAAGDVAILVCMHVATKEISNWTWQTFYWDPNPTTPKFPGTNLSKPSQLSPTAAHYSASTAYAMLAPNQKISGGDNDPRRKPVIGFNPYLEANFDSTTFTQAPNRYNTNYIYGVQTNCMSCHAFAAYTPTIPLATQQKAPPRYSTDQYVDMSDTTYFKNYVILDFAWSLQGTIFAVTPSANK